MVGGGTIFDDPILIQVAISRFWEFREHRPFIRWETLSDSADSTYGAYVTGNPNARGQRERDSATCACLCNGPYFATDPHNWADFSHVGGKKGGGESPKIHHGKRQVTLEADQAMRTALRLWFPLDRPQYADKDDLELFAEPDPVYYARQGRGFAKEMNVAKSPHMASRKERDAYRSRLREGKAPRDTKTGRCLCQAGEFNLMYRQLREEIYGKDAFGPFRAPGRKPMVGISAEAEKRFEESRGWLWDRDERRRREEEGASPSAARKGEPNYSGRWKKGETRSRWIYENENV